MTRRRTGPNRVRRVEELTPSGLREVLEKSRLSLRALFRALDRLGLAQEVPAELRRLFELDADLAEALWGLDQPCAHLDAGAMTRDTMESLGAIPEALTAFLARLSAPAQAELAYGVKVVRASLSLTDAYLQIPGRDPAAG